MGPIVVVCKITNFYCFKQKPYVKQNPYVIVGTHGVAQVHVGPKSGLIYKRIPKGFPIPFWMFTSFAMQIGKHNVDMGLHGIFPVGPFG